MANGGAPHIVSYQNKWIENVNDDPHDQTEDDDMIYRGNTTWTDNLYAYDGPGLGAWNPGPVAVIHVASKQAVVSWVMRDNFSQMVRVKIGGDPIPANGNGVFGSRSSPIFTWFNMERYEQVMFPGTGAGRTHLNG